MKRNQKGSILLWSIFLVMFVSFSFLYISDGISKKINKNKQSVLGFVNNETTKKIFFNSFSGTLKQNEKLSFSFEESNTGTINILNGGLIYYEVFSGSIFYTGGIITSSKSIQTFSGITLSTLGGFSKFSISFSGNNGITFPYNYEKVVKNIGGSDVVKSVVEVK